MIFRHYVLRTLFPCLSLWFIGSEALGQSSTASTTTWVTNGHVRAIVQHGGLAYIGGDFQYVGPRRPFGAVVNSTDGLLSSSQALPNGPVYAVVPIPDGADDGSDPDGWYIGGAFTQVNGQPRNRLARINFDGSLDASFTPSVEGGTVFALALALADGYLYVGGDYSTIGDGAYSSLARMNTTSGSPDDNWKPALSGGAVRALAVYSGSLFAGGDFTTIGSTAYNGLASFQISPANAIPSTWNPNVVGGPVKALAVRGTDLIVGGDFTTIAGSSSTPRLTAFSLTTPESPSHNTAWIPSPNGSVNAFAVGSDDKLYVGGTFTTISDKSNISIASYASGTLGSSASTVTQLFGDKTVNSIVESSGKLYVGGRFNSVGSATTFNVAVMNAVNGSQDASWLTSTSDTVFAMVPNGSKTYIGGNCSSIGGRTRKHLASLDPTTGEVTVWDPNINHIFAGRAITALALDGDILYAAGEFKGTFSQIRNKLASYDLKNSGSLTDWNPNPTYDQENPNSTLNSIIGEVNVIAVSSNYVYVGGNFTKIAGQNRDRLAALSKTNAGTPITWSTGITSGTVNSIAVKDAKIYVGGNFVSPRLRLALYEEPAPPGAPVLSSWDPKIDERFSGSSNPRINAIAVSKDGKKVYIGGVFDFVGGVYPNENVRSRLACFDATDGSLTPWSADLPGFSPVFPREVKSILLSGNTVYVGGRFDEVKGSSRYNIAAVDANTEGTTVLNAWAPVTSLGTPSTVDALAVVGSSIYAGGNFNATSTTPITNLASYAITDVGWIGGNGGSWNDPENWNPGAVPGNSTIVTIASGYPVMDVDHTVGATGSMTISGTGSLVVAPGKTLTIAGTANFDGKSVTLRSTSAGTAAIGQVTGTLSGATNVTVERYIKKNAIVGGTGRAWRLVSIPVTGNGKLRDFFMNGQPGRDLTNEAARNLETANSGTPIVGHNYASATLANLAGFDYIGVPNQVSSLRRYVGNTSGGTFLSEDVPDMNTTFTGAEQGYMVFTRGDRKQEFPTTVTPSASATTFRSTGVLKWGNQTVSVAPSNSSKYTLVGNPYPSVLNLAALYTANPSVINPSFWIWDANLEGNFKQGGYVHVTLSGTTWVTNTGTYTNPERIESGTAFFVEPVSSSSAADITISESHKYTGTTPGISPFSTDNDDIGRVYVRLETKGDSGIRQIVDGVRIDFQKDFKETLGDASDREKMRNTISQGGLWLSREGRSLVAEGLPWPGAAKRSITLYMGSVGSQQRILRIDPRAMADKNAKVWLKDRYLGSETEVDMSKGLDYAFTGTGAATDSARFELVFAEAARPGTGGVAIEPGTGDEKPSVMLYPNPSASSDVKLSLRSMPTGDYVVQVVDLKGSLLMNSRITHSGRNEEYRILKGRRLPPGRYIVRLIDGKGGVQVLQMASE